MKTEWNSGSIKEERED